MWGGGEKSARYDDLDLGATRKPLRLTVDVCQEGVIDGHVRWNYLLDFIVASKNRWNTSSELRVGIRLD
jgi:hypothetical protein